MVLARHITYTFWDTIFFYNFWFRTFLIWYANGFIRKGATDLKLFHQLHWIICVSYVAVVLFGIFPTPSILRGDFPLGSTSGKICLLVPLKKSELYLKINSFVIVMTLVCIVFTLYAKSRTCRFLKVLCPRNKMACIRKYQRNVLNYDEHMFVVMYWLLFSQLEIIMSSLYIFYDTDPKIVIYIDIIIFVVFKDLLQLFATFLLIERGIPSHTDPPGTKFYVSNQSLLLPRKPQYCETYKHSKLHQTQHLFDVANCSSFHSQWSMEAQGGSVQDFNPDEGWENVTIQTLNKQTIEYNVFPRLRSQNREKQQTPLKVETHNLGFQADIESDIILHPHCLMGMEYDLGQ